MSILREFHARYFPHLHILESQWAVIEGRPAPRLRLGKTQLEMEVRHSEGVSRWELLAMPMGRTVGTDNYHPQVEEASAVGGKNSKKGHS